MINPRTHATTSWRAASLVRPAARRGHGPDSRKSVADVRLASVPRGGSRGRSDRRGDDVESLERARLRERRRAPRAHGGGRGRAASWGRGRVPRLSVTDPAASQGSEATAAAASAGAGCATPSAAGTARQVGHPHDSPSLIYGRSGVGASRPLSSPKRHAEQDRTVGSGSGT